MFELGSRPSVPCVLQVEIPVAVLTTPEMPFKDVAFTRRRVSPPRYPEFLSSSFSFFFLLFFFFLFSFFFFFFVLLPSSSTFLLSQYRSGYSLGPVEPLLHSASSPSDISFLTAFFFSSFSSDLRIWLSILLHFLSRIPPLLPLVSSTLHRSVVRRGCLGNVTIEVAASPLQRKLEERVENRSAPWLASCREEGVWIGVVSLQVPL